MNQFDPKKMKAILWIGISLISTALCLLLYSNWEIMLTEKILATSNLSIEEAIHYEELLYWWKTVYANTIAPTAVFFTISGTLSLVSLRLKMNLNKRLLS